MKYKENQHSPNHPWFINLKISFVKAWKCLMVDLGIKRIHKIKE